MIAVGALKEAAMASTAGNPGEDTIYGGESVRVEQLLPDASARLVTVAHDASLREAARLLVSGTDLVVVCGAEGAVMGVITKTDVVASIGECEGASCALSVAVAMSADVLLCAPHDLVQDVWSRMRARELKNVPITDVDGHPLGVLNARDALGVLLHEARYGESLLRDYVMGVGYR